MLAESAIDGGSHADLRRRGGRDSLASSSILESQKVSEDRPPPSSTSEAHSNQRDSVRRLPVERTPVGLHSSSARCGAARGAARKAVAEEKARAVFCLLFLSKRLLLKNAKCVGAAKRGAGVDRSAGRRESRVLRDSLPRPSLLRAFACVRLLKMADTRQPKTREGGAAAGGEIPSVEGSQPSRGRQGLFEDSSKESPSPHRPPTADGSSHRRGGKDRRGRMPRKSLSGVEPSVNTAETLAKETLFTKEEKSTLLPKPLTSSPEEKRKAEDALRSKATAAARESAQRQRLVHNAEKQKQRPRHGPGGGEASSVQRSSQSARGDGSGNSSPAQQTPRFSRRFERLMQVPNPMEGEGDEAFFSDDEEEPNRIGDVPLWWYEKYRHIGEINEASEQGLFLCAAAQFAAKAKRRSLAVVLGLSDDAALRFGFCDGFGD